MPNSGMFTINWHDVFRGAVVAIATGAFISVVGLFSADFDVFTADWASIARQAVNGGFYSFVGYLTKNFFSNDNGKVAGVIG